MYKGEERSIRDYLNDILEMIEDIWNFTKNMSYEDLERDKKTLDSVIGKFLLWCALIHGQFFRNALATW